MTGHLTTVVITRNRCDQLMETLPRHREPVVVVDNGSSDGTAQAVAARFPSVRLVRSDRNLGAFGRTVGARAADGDHIAFADDDSWWEPASLDTAVEALDSHPGVGLLAARVLVEPGAREDPFNSVLGSSPLPAERPGPGIPVLGFMACAAVVRRTAFLAVGGFDPALGIGGEEDLLAWDLAAAGWDLRHLDSLIVHHEPRAGSGRGGTRVASLHRARILSAVMRRRLPTVAASVLAAGRSGPDGLRGLAGAARLLPYAVAHRHRLPDDIERRLRALGS